MFFIPNQHFQKKKEKNSYLQQLFENQRLTRLICSSPKNMQQFHFVISKCKFIKRSFNFIVQSHPLFNCILYIVVRKQAAQSKLNFKLYSFVFYMIFSVAYACIIEKILLFTTPIYSNCLIFTIHNTLTQLPKHFPKTNLPSALHITKQAAR